MTPELARTLVVLAWIIGGVIVLGAVAAIVLFLGVGAVLREMWREDRDTYRKRWR